MMIKETISLIAIFLTFYAFFIYARSIFLGKTKPHVFSWVIWSLVTIVVFLAQLADGGGAGAWPIGISGVITIGIAVLAYHKRGEIQITHIDKIFFFTALLSIPIWYLTQNPLWTVIILTSIDLLGFAPTFRKTYHAPFSEPLGFIFLMGIRNTLSILALEHYSVTTTLFPAAVAAACGAFVIMIIIRRKLLEPT